MVAAVTIAARGEKTAVASQEQIGDPICVALQTVQQDTLLNVPHLHRIVATIVVAAARGEKTAVVSQEQIGYPSGVAA
jgi:hypothetical protein